MINQVHSDGIIGIKKLSSSDLGIRETSNQTHIGLFEGTLDFIDSEHTVISSQLIYSNRNYELLSLLDYIENPDGTFRSPKIRKGAETELFANGIRVDSVVRKIRDIVQDTNERTPWYLLWFGLDTNELVFLLFNSASSEFLDIQNIVGTIGERIKISRNTTSFNRLITYLNKTVETVNIEYYKELEIASQTDSDIVTQRIIPRVRDIEKANRLFEATGLKGEELLNIYFEQEKLHNNIRDFKWVNQSRETGFPYDFEITGNDNSIIFSDAKTTSYKFDQPMILSTGELKFINKNSDKYLIHRVYSINETPKLRICDNIADVSDIFVPRYQSFNNDLSNNNLKIKSLKLAVPSNLDILNFGSEIQIRFT